MKPFSFCFFGLLALALEIASESCNLQSQNIDLTEMNGKVWYFQEGQQSLPLINFNCVKCLVYFNKTDKTGNFNFTLKFPMVTETSSFVLNFKQNDGGDIVIKSADDNEGTIMAVIFKNTDGLVTKQINKVNNILSEELAVITFKEEVSDQTVDDLLKGACITNKTNWIKVNNTGC